MQPINTLNLDTFKKVIDNLNMLLDDEEKLELPSLPKTIKGMKGAKAKEVESFLDNEFDKTVQDLNDKGITLPDVVFDFYNWLFGDENPNENEVKPDEPLEEEEELEEELELEEEDELEEEPKPKKETKKMKKEESKKTEEVEKEEVQKKPTKTTAAAAKKTTKTTATKKTTTKKPPASEKKKTPTKKTTVKKTVAKKTPAKKPATKKTTTGKKPNNKDCFGFVIGGKTSDFAMAIGKKPQTMASIAGLGLGKHPKAFKKMKEKKLMTIDKEGIIHLTARGKKMYDKFVSK